MQPIALDSFLPYRLAVVADRLSRVLVPLYEGRHGLSTPQWRVIAAVADRPGRTAQDVVRMTPMEKATVSRAVSALIARGLMMREADARDGRASRLVLTSAGEAVYADIAPAARAVEAGLVAGLPEGGSIELLGMLDAIEEALDSVASVESAG